MQSSGDWAGYVRDVSTTSARRRFWQFSDPFEVDNAGISRTPQTSSFGLCSSAILSEFVIIDLLSLF
jgi:hypothetical protein